MANNKTVIPGIDNQPSFQPQGPQINNFNQPMPPFGNVGAQTVCSNAAAPIVEGFSPKGQLFGFLFSVSKTMAGEYWPLYLGANTIGRGRQNSIQLLETTVSDNHANIHIVSRSGKMFASLSDSSSKTGVLLNNELLISESYIKNGDVITIGESYELYVILLNAVELNLGVKESFKPANDGPVLPPPFPGGFPGAPKGGNATVVEGQAGPIPMGGHTMIMGGPLK